MLVSECSPHHDKGRLFGKKPGHCLGGQGEGCRQRDRWTSLSAPGALQNPGPRRLREDAGSFPKFVARRWQIPLSFSLLRVLRALGRSMLPPRAVYSLAGLQDPLRFLETESCVSPRWREDSTGSQGPLGRHSKQIRIIIL